ncbi:MAG: hypothetical protein SRB2_04714 [Desulfobacteraceae bacterium Eth-SRB2]|nr:MAG: hypothetical protein SRB2_04714 [Desulfobacteraceae bacterium Eth-SRB2]
MSKYKINVMVNFVECDEEIDFFSHRIGRWEL